MRDIVRNRAVPLALTLLTVAGCLGSDDVTGNQNGGPGDISFVSVAVGGFHACGLDADGQAFCWGGNGVGQLGNGGVLDQFQPVAVDQGSREFTQLMLGSSHSCAIGADFTMSCWGGNAEAQLGVGNQTIAQLSPLDVGGDEDFFLGAAGGAHTCGLNPDGQAFCWGFQSSGQLGNGVSGGSVPQSTPDSVLGGLTWRAITAGDFHTCALTSSSRAYCWGEGDLGQLGEGARDNRAEPVPVAGDLVFQVLSAGGEHTCGVALDGAAYCWGKNESGQLGTADNADRTTPAEIAGNLSFSTISAGGNHTCGVTDGNAAYCWGSNNAGQLGDGTTSNRNEPTLVAGNIDFTSVGAGKGVFDTASCGMGGDGLVYCWGFGGSGQVGSGNTTNALTPVRVAGQADDGDGGGGVLAPARGGS